MPNFSGGGAEKLMTLVANVLTSNSRNPLEKTYCTSCFKTLSANLSYLIGARKWWGKGIASLAIATITEIGFQQIGLMKICAGVYENNIASSKVLLKNGYSLEGRRVGQYVYKNKRIDALLYAKHKDTYTAVKSDN